MKKKHTVKKRIRSPLGTTFKTIAIDLPAKKRAIAVSGEALRQNDTLNNKNMWPVIEIFDVPRDGNLAKAKPYAVEVQNRSYSVVRHVKILGPATVAHDPSRPLAGNRRRSSVMVTDAPLRVYVDTERQLDLVGQRPMPKVRAPKESSWRSPFGC